MSHIQVCVAVTTYNASEYILETLESAFNQNYDNIELIISDDYSTDSTLDLVRAWINEPRVVNRFNSIELITVPHNTGIPANCNRILKAAKSDYIKMIAGDDILYPNCLMDNISFVKNQPKANIIFSRVDVFKDSFQKENWIKSSPHNFPVDFMGEAVSASAQFKMLLVVDRISFTPSFFFKKQAIVDIGGYDETNKLIEDYPMWLKLTRLGEKLYYFDVPTVGYRAHSRSLSNSDKKTLFKVSFKQGFEVKKAYVFQYLTWLEKAKEYYIYFWQLAFDFFGMNKQNKLNSFLYKILFFYANPFYILSKLLK